MKQTQIQYVKDRIKETGQISRNDCLSRYISRLGAIIAVLKAQGYKFDSYYQNQEHGKDYIYVCVNRPKPSVYEKMHENIRRGRVVVDENRQVKLLL